MTPSAFQLLDSKIQEAIWDLRWSELRPIQVDAIQTLLTTEKQIILAAATASGKTEAAFLPILSQLATKPKPSIQAMYVSPLKALINDQFRRLEELCSHTHVPVHKWHGDVSSSKKRRLRESPRGVLLITPESLESNFINYGSSLSHIYPHLEYVVIDELHSFLDDVRGIHLKSLLARLRAATGCNPRMLGLSATLGDFTPASEFLSPEDPKNVEIIEDEGSDRDVKVGVRNFLEVGNKEEERKEGEVGDSEPSVWDEVARELARSFSAKSNLIFTNSRRLAEILADRLRQITERERWPKNPFYVHHGSLGKDHREDVEERLKSGDPITALCTATLEMGIDIGSVNAIGQVGPPWSVSSLIQRLGRSGRQEGESAILRLYAVDEIPGPDASVTDSLYPRLIRSIALIQLMIGGWLEPIDKTNWHLSTCIHQILSILRQTGGTRADRLYHQLCVGGPFEKIDIGSFRTLLRNLGSEKVIEQIPTGELILAPLGERTVESHEFYAAFVGDTEVGIYHDSDEIGTMAATDVPPVGHRLILGGKRWCVDDIDLSQRKVYVIPTKGAKPPQFSGTGGAIHERVVQEMRRVLSDTTLYPYLHPDAIGTVEEARATFRSLGLGERSVLLGSSRTEWFPWVGTQAMTTIALAASVEGLKASSDRLSIVLRNRHEGQVESFLEKLSKGAFDPVELARELPVKEQHRFDEWAGAELLDRANAESRIHLQSAAKAAESALDEIV